MTHIVFLMNEFLPIHGTLQALVSSSSNLSPPQASRGMREDEVLQIGVTLTSVFSSLIAKLT